MAIALVESQFGPTSTRNLQFCFFAIFGPILFYFLSCWLEMWFFANAIPSPMSLSYISLLKPTSLTCFQGTKWIQDKRDQGQNGTRTIWNQDNMEPGQNGTRTKWIQDKMDPGQNGSRTRWIQDKMEPGHKGSRTIWIQDNRDPGQWASIGTIGIHRYPILSF